MQEHNMYMNLLGELSAGIKERISQKLVSAVRPNYTLFSKFLPWLVLCITSHVLGMHICKWVLASGLQKQDVLSCTP